MSNKVLIITYYWPPSGGGGVQRWLKFAKYLPESGWEPIVFTPENPDFDLKDESLLGDVSSQLEVIRFPIWEPFGVYKRLFKSGSKDLKQGVVIEKSKLSLLEKIIIWVRGNLLIPDARKYWVKPSVQFLTSFVKDHNIDVIITTGPPHSMHLIGLELKKRIDVKWVADFRDPWSDWDILDKLKTSRFVKAIHRNLEKKVLLNADKVLVTTPKTRELFLNKNNRYPVDVLTNGVDHMDLRSYYEGCQTDKFRITHLGLLNELRNPDGLWRTLEKLCQNEQGFAADLEILLSGMVSGSIMEVLNKSDALSSKLVYRSYIAHEEIFGYYKNSSVLLLLMNQTTNADWLIPAKLFEYLASNQTILALGSENSDVNKILTSCNAKEVVSYDDESVIYERVLLAYRNFKSGYQHPKYLNVASYFRKNLTQDLSKILTQLNDITEK